MYRNKLLNLLSDYALKYPNEKNIVKRFINFINENKNCFNRNLLNGHITGSAWVLNNNKTSVLLTHHKKLHKWLQLGGHADGNSDILNVALKEVYEESGLTNLEIVSNRIFDLDIHSIPARKNEPEHYHYDVRFLFKTNGNQKFIVSKESFSLRWINLNEVHKLTNENSIIRMVNKTFEFYY